MSESSSAESGMKPPGTSVGNRLANAPHRNDRKNTERLSAASGTTFSTRARIGCMEANCVTLDLFFTPPMVQEETVSHIMKVLVLATIASGLASGQPPSVSQVLMYSATPPGLNVPTLNGTSSFTLSRAV